MPQYNTRCYFYSTEYHLNNIILSTTEEIMFIDYGNSYSSFQSPKIETHIYGIEILAASKEKADHITELIMACNAVLECSNYVSIKDIIRGMDKHTDDMLSGIGTKEVLYGSDSLLFACQMVKKVYGNQKCENAVCKYYVAQEIYSLHPMELAPWEDAFINEYLLIDRIRIANVVVNCYAILEELHLQIKASEGSPSVVDGKWNLEVREELSKRLKGKNISPSKTIPWLTRNGFVRPFKNSAIGHDVLCSWSDGKKICDFEITICDAILELSHIRSQIASHGVNRKILKLSVYDAENSFALARALLLDFFGINWLR